MKPDDMIVVYSVLIMAIGMLVSVLIARFLNEM